MKKVFSFVMTAAAALSIFSACSKEVLDSKTTADEFTFVGYLDQTGMKTTLDGTKVYWKTGDEVSVNGSIFVATVDEANPSRATFALKAGQKAPATAATYRICYPATSYKATATQFALPAQQTYAADDISGVNPMYAQTTDYKGSTVNFKNVCGLLALDLKGTDKVASIKVTATGSYLSGTLSNFAYNTESGAITYSSFATSGRSASVTLNCVTPVQLSAEEATTFYVALPEKSYTSLSIVISTPDGRTMTVNSTKTCPVTKSNKFTVPLTVAMDPVTFGIQTSEITYNSAKVSYNPSPATVHYYCDCIETELVSTYGLDVIISSDLSYFVENYGVEAVYEQLCAPGPYSPTYDELDAETSYTAFAVAVDENLNLVSEIESKEFTTEAKPERTFYGNAIWHDVFVSAAFDMEGEVLDMPCDVYTSASTPGVFYFDAPYNYANIASWFGITPEELKPYGGNWKRVELSIDCSDPAQCKMAVQDLGVSLSSTFGWVSGGFEFGYTYDSYGTYEDGVITFDANGSRYVYYGGANKGLYAKPLEYDFKVTITSGGSPIYPDAEVTNAVTKSTKAVIPTPSSLKRLQGNTLQSKKKESKKSMIIVK